MGGGVIQQKKFFAELLEELRSANSEVRARFDSGLNGMDIYDLLYKTHRCAIAHATSGNVVNPDDPKALESLNLNMSLMKAVADWIMEKKLLVKTEASLYAEKGKAPPVPSGKFVAHEFGNILGQFHSGSVILKK